MDWRRAAAASLTALPPLSDESVLTGTISGDIVAGTARLDATIELAGATTILARQVVLTGRSLTVRSNGFALRVFPVQAVRPATMAGPAVAAAQPIRIGSEGQAGTDGTLGFPGSEGLPGQDGSPGESAFGNHAWDCGGGPGGNGTKGDAGGAGGTGTNGGAGGNGPPITFDIPDGDTNAYEFVSRGGPGGRGGVGGRGGEGREGGQGGRGGDAYQGFPAEEPPPPCDGGPGGNGGNGGNGGAITVTYPAQGYDPAMITVDVSGGVGGAGGAGGVPGTPGYGGWGGDGGMAGLYGSPGASGQPGSLGLVGPSSYGQVGAQGNPGTSTVGSRASGPLSLSITPASGSTTPGGSVTAAVAVASTTGESQTVTLSASGLPAGASASFDPPAITTGASSTMTVATGTGTPLGAHLLIVTGTAAGGTAQAAYTLNVTGAPTGCSAANQTDVPIPPHPLDAESPIAISGCGLPSRLGVTVGISIVHPDRSNLRVYLIDPSGNAYYIYTPDDAAANVDDTYRLGAWNVPADCQWRLLVHDIVSHNGAYIDSWSITLTSLDPPPAVGPHHVVAVHSGKCLDVAGGSTADGAQVWQWSCGDQRWRIEPLGSGRYLVVAVHSGKCLSVNVVPVGVAPPIQLPSVQQAWYLMPTGINNTYYLVGWNTMCLAVANSAVSDGATLLPGSCGTAPNQRWRLEQ